MTSSFAVFEDVELEVGEEGANENFDGKKEVMPGYFDKVLFV